jgi:acetyltransferase-like isoleucine patch superfamily enzyme
VGEACALSGVVHYHECENTTVKIGNSIKICNLLISISGNNTLVQIDDNVQNWKPDAAILINVFNPAHVKIGQSTTFNGNIQLNSTSSDIKIGEKCMFSEEIVVQDLTYHSIYDLHSGEQIYKKKNIHISDHVWVGLEAKILGNARVGANSIVGAYAVVAGAYPNNCAIAGNPAQIVRRDIMWHATHSWESPQNLKDFPSGLILPEYLQMTRDVR